MDNPFDEMQRALNLARTVQEAADANAARMASMLRGRLRKCNRWDLAALKKELKNFNAHTHEWTA